MSFTNPLFNQQYLAKQDQQDSDTDYEDHSNPTDSSKALYFLNNLCIESQQDPSPPPPPLVHSTSRQTFQQQQPLFILNNGYMTQNNQIENGIELFFAFMAVKMSKSLPNIVVPFQYYLKQ